jgi:hypothetical protein
MLDDLEEGQLPRYGLLRRKRTPRYVHAVTGQGSPAVWVAAPVDQDDEAEIDRMLAAGAGPTEIRKWLDDRFKDQWGDVLLMLGRMRID